MSHADVISQPCNGVTILFNNGYKTIENTSSYKWSCLIDHLETITKAGFSTKDGYDLVMMNHVITIARQLYWNQQANN